MSFEIVYRIKNKLTDTYWNGKDFGSIGKIYVNPALAEKAITKGQLSLRVEDEHDEYDLVVTETRIEDVNIL